MKTIFVRLQLNSCLIRIRFIVLFSVDEHITCYSIQFQYDYNTYMVFRDIDIWTWDVNK